MENSINQKNWINLIHCFNFNYTKMGEVILIQPNTSPQYEVLYKYLEEINIPELDSVFVVKTFDFFPPTIYQEIIDHQTLGDALIMSQDEYNDLTK